MQNAFTYHCSILTLFHREYVTEKQWKALKKKVLAEKYEFL